MEIFLSNFVRIFLDGFEIYIIYRYMTVFFENRYIDKRLAMITYAIRFVLSVTVGYMEVYSWISAMIALGSIVLISLCYMSAMSKRLIISVLIYMCSFAAEAIMALIVGLSDFNVFARIEQGSFFRDFIIEFLFWLISIVVQRFKNVGGNSKVPLPFVVAIVIIPFSLICLESIIFSQNIVNNMMAGISLICLIASILILIYLYDSLSEMFREREETAVVLCEKEYYHQQSILLKDKYEELRQYRHDMKNRIITIQQMLNEKKYTAVLEYTGEISSKLSETLTFSNTGNIALDGLINYKLSKISQENIIVQTSITIPENISIEEDDLVVVIGNLLDNAIEAVNRIEGDVERYIRIDFEYERGSVWICVKNSFDNIVNIRNNRLETRKFNHELHGIGIQSVESVVSKYNGLMEISMEEDFFIVDVLLYLQ